MYDLTPEHMEDKPKHPMAILGLCVSTPFIALAILYVVAMANGAPIGL